MDILTNLDGKGLKATNFADGTADTDLATVGQINSSFAPVIFEGSVDSYIVWNQTSTNTSINTTLNKTELFTSRYANNCSYISDGTNDVVEITQTGFFKATLTGHCEYYAVLAGTGFISMQSLIYLIDPTNKAVVFNGGDQSSQVLFFLNTITGTQRADIPFSVTRIYHNTSGTLKIGAYIYCYINTTNASSRSFVIVYPTLTVTRV